MIYEYALEPELVAKWHERKEYLFFDEKFGIRARRLISGYPKNWKKLVWESFSKSPACDDQNAKMRMTEIIQFLWQKAVRRPSTYPEIKVWLDRAEAEHQERPFHAVIALSNPRERSFVIQEKDLIEKGHNLWIIPTQNPTPRTANEIGKELAPLLKLSKHIILMDPYFDPDKPQYSMPLQAILINCTKNICGMENIEFELHTSIDRFFQPWEVGAQRNPKDEKKVLISFENACKSRIPILIPQDLKLKIVIWKKRDKGEKIHNRYLLTNIHGVMMGTGSDASKKTDANESDDFVLLEDGQYLVRYQQYSGLTSVFDMACKPFIIHSKIP